MKSVKLDLLFVRETARVSGIENITITRPKAMKKTNMKTC